MTRTVADNAILLSAMMGEDSEDQSTINVSTKYNYYTNLDTLNLKELSFSINKLYLSDSLYARAVSLLENEGADTIEFNPPTLNFSGFTTILSGDMKKDLPEYFKKFGSEKLPFKSVGDIVAFNQQDSTLRIPYGQHHFENTMNETISQNSLDSLFEIRHQEATSFFKAIFDNGNPDVILSINNYNAGHAALAKHPCITIPMGYKDSGEPINLTLIGKSREEDKLLKIAYSLEQKLNFRIPPSLFSDSLPKNRN
jgi:amidase